MHAFSHSLAHRAPSATRRVRWQPYSTLSTQTSSSSTISSHSPSSQISTPSSSLTSPPSNSIPNETKQCTHANQNHKETPPTKNKYAVGLVDQAVKTLCEIWRPQDIPPAFLASSKAGTALGTSIELSSNKSTHLVSHRVAGSLSATPSTSSALSPSTCGNDPRSTLVPIKGFVHEVIRRSRTSGCVLQTALCYLEAIRPKVPDLVRKEQSGRGVLGELDLSCRIMPATELELRTEEQCLQAEPSSLDLEQLPPVGADDMAPTVRIDDIEPACPSSSVEEDLITQNLNSTEPSLLAMPALPSPLLCPRRAFLAALILASKFTQDKCYSNRAWAKLSGLPAREIGRCERALGEALEWRLWVGKSPVQSQLTNGSPSSSSTSNRPVSRSQSESNILSTPSNRSPFLVRSDIRSALPPPSAQRILQRSSTMPVESFTTSSGVWSPADCRPLAPTMLKSTQQSFDGVLASSAVPPQIYTDVSSQSPSPDNPGLSYSPSSTESSSGDRTVQMSTFLDEPMATYSVSQAPTATEFWPWSETGDVSQDLRISPPSATQYSRVAKVAPTSSCDVYGLPIQGFAISEHLPHTGPAIAPTLPWSAEGETYRSLTLMTQ